MALKNCPECGASVSDRARDCPGCGYPLKPSVRYEKRLRRLAWGYEYKSDAQILGIPLLHVAIGRDADTGKLLMAKGIIAIGQFGLGLITIAQFGIGLVFGFGQFVGGFIEIGQFAIGLYFGMGQFATGYTAIGQFAIGEYVLAQIGFGKHVWSSSSKDPVAIEHFRNLWECIRSLWG